MVHERGADRPVRRIEVLIHDEPGEGEMAYSHESTYAPAPFTLNSVGDLGPVVLRCVRARIGIVVKFVLRELHTKVIAELHPEGKVDRGLVPRRSDGELVAFLSALALHDHRKEQERREQLLVTCVALRPFEEAERDVMRVDAHFLQRRPRLLIDTAELALHCVREKKCLDGIVDMLLFSRTFSRGLWQVVGRLKVQGFGVVLDFHVFVWQHR